MAPSGRPMGATCAAAAGALGLLGLAAGNAPGYGALGQRHHKNPFQEQVFYLNPVNAAELQKSIDTAIGLERENLQEMHDVPSAYWVDTKHKIPGTSTGTVEGILRDASSKSPTEMVVFIFYDLPNRDCDAKASNGEICCTRGEDGRCDYLAPGDCTEGIKEYKTEYVDPFADVLAEFDGKVPVAIVMEPDGLANLATNINDPHCGNKATQAAYKEGVAYAVKQITKKSPSTVIYLDAAHGGWLGWDNNMGLFMKMLKSMDMPWSSIRGFATNVANYQALGIQCPWCPDQGTRNGYCLNEKHQDDLCCEDPCSLESQYNPGNNELNYAAGLVAGAAHHLKVEAHVIIDTGRNGVADQRQDCANWCNPRGAGAGVKSSWRTANRSLVDAYFWLKTPGESDGCTEMLPDGRKCPRFDSKCKSVDSLGTKPMEPRAPEAGQWFDFQVKQLARHAKFEGPKPELNGSAECPAARVNEPSSPSGQNKNDKKGSPVPASPKACAWGYQQCGGTNWAGPKCCQTDCTCSGSGGYYSQCTPPPGKYNCSTPVVVETTTSAVPATSSSDTSTRASARRTTVMTTVVITKTTTTTTVSTAVHWGLLPLPWLPLLGGKNAIVDQAILSEAKDTESRASSRLLNTVGLIVLLATALTGVAVLASRRRRPRACQRGERSLARFPSSEDVSPMLPPC
mmetsp:Transcript_106609/g.206525  ORF Transcript_106609/g.206525 Transcript_106609/m.206525 type:complete len:683 (-) Transcript_106609:131-2179(-)